MYGNFLLILHSLSILTIIILIRSKYLQSKHLLLQNYFFYAVTFVIIYLNISSIFYLITKISPFTESYDIITSSALYSLYFAFILILAFKFYKFKPIHYNKKYDISDDVAKIFFLIIFILQLYIFSVFYIESQNLISSYGDRKALSAINTFLISKYKFGLIYNFISFLVLAVVNKYKSFTPFIAFIPFIILDIFSGGRYYIVMTLLQVIFLYSYFKKTINLKIGFLLLFILIVYRNFKSEEFFLENFIGESIFTMGNTHLVIDNQVSVDIIESFIVMIFRILPLTLFDYATYWYTPYIELTSEFNPLYAGLGGSMVAEAVSHGKLGILLFPIILLIYGKVYKTFFRNQGWLGLYFRILSVIIIWQSFRFSLVLNLLYPISLTLLFSLLWHLKFRKKY